MTKISGAARFATFLMVVACAAGVAVPASAAEKVAQPATQPESAVSRQAVPAKPKLDHSGRKRVGKASIYAKKFAGRKMASGKRMDPQDNNAASRTLPLGTEAKVTNLETGQSAVVDIEDRGPYVKGRMVDLSPSTARKIGIDEKKGVADVEVVPLAVPQPDGSVKPGTAAKDNSKTEKNRGKDRGTAGQRGK